MLVSLYTSRVMLAALGVSDYGVYNVVAGFITLFTVINNGIASGTQRFLNYTLGEGNDEKIRSVFMTSFLLHAAIAVVFSVLAEVAGLTFAVDALNIPDERRNAAMAAYHFAIATSALGILKGPFNAAVIAYERMSFFAWMSIVEVVLKLASVMLLTLSPADKLITYSALITAVNIITLLIYALYCFRHFPVTQIYHLSAYKVRNKALVKNMAGYSGWLFLENISNMASGQGTNIVINIFTNVTVNAAMGVANQVNAAVSSFVSNFQTAFKPQIVKSYAAGRHDEFSTLALRVSKMSFFLLYMIAMPLYLNLDLVLSVWLKEVPEHASNFIRLILFCSMISSMDAPLWMSIQAVGKLNVHATVISALTFSDLPLSIIAFTLGAPPEIVLVIRLIRQCVMYIWRIIYVGRVAGIPRRMYVFQTALCALIAAVSFAATSLVGSFFPAGAPYFFATCIASVIFSGALILMLGLTKDERGSLLRILKARLHRNR